ncbi:MAG: hypothetical protein RL885_20235 [Planctomycetota bacterium]
MRSLFVLTVLTLIVTVIWIVSDDSGSSHRTTSNIDGDHGHSALESATLDELRDRSVSARSVLKEPAGAFDQPASSSPPSAIEVQQGESKDARAFDRSITAPPRRFIDQDTEQVLSDPRVNPLGLGLSEMDLGRFDELRKDLSTDLEISHRMHGFACLLEGVQLVEKGQYEIYTPYQAVPRNHEYEYFSHRGEGKDRNLVARVDPTRADASQRVLDSFADWKSAEYEAERQLARFVDLHGR